MKKLLLWLFIGLFFVSQAEAATGWVKTKPASSDSPSTIPTTVGENNAALDLMLSAYQQGCKIAYSSAAQITVGAGGVMVSNSAGTVRLMLANSAATTVTWSDIDTGSEAASTTYYVYAIGSATTDTAFTVKISTSSTAPTGVTYYKRLGSFYNDASSNITLITNDENKSNTNKTYDSDWFTVAASGSYEKTHNLGTTKYIIQVFGAASTDGSGTNYALSPYYDLRPASDKDGFGLATTSTTITLNTGSVGIIVASDTSMTAVNIRSIRIILLAIDD